MYYVFLLVARAKSSRQFGFKLATQQGATSSRQRGQMGSSSRQRGGPNGFKLAPTGFYKWTQNKFKWMFLACFAFLTKPLASPIFTGIQPKAGFPLFGSFKKSIKTLSPTYYTCDKFIISFRQVVFNTKSEMICGIILV